MYLNVKNESVDVKQPVSSAASIFLLKFGGNRAAPVQLKPGGPACTSVP